MWGIIGRGGTFFVECRSEAGYTIILPNVTGWECRFSPADGGITQIIDAENLRKALRFSIAQMQKDPHPEG